MAVIAYGADSGNTRDESPVDGGIDPTPEPIRSIFDLGSEPVGSEYESDSSATGNAESGSGTGTAFDPASVTPGDSDAPFGRFPDGRARKRRPKGSGSGGSGNSTSGRGSGQTPRKTASEVSTFIAECLSGIHEIAANFTNCPELSLADEEAAAEGEALVRLGQEYDVPMPDAKTMAWINLAKVLSMVYGTRVTAIRMRLATERARKPQPIRQVG